MVKDRKKVARIRELERKNRELEAQLAYVYHYAKHGIAKTDRSQMKGSGIVVQLHWIGGKEVCPAFLMKDGFSKATIDALTEDLKFSYAETTAFKP